METEWKRRLSRIVPPNTVRTSPKLNQTSEPNNNDLKWSHVTIKVQKSSNGIQNPPTSNGLPKRSYKEKVGVKYGV